MKPKISEKGRMILRNHRLAKALMRYLNNNPEKGITGGKPKIKLKNIIDFL